MSRRVLICLALLASAANAQDAPKQQATKQTETAQPATQAADSKTQTETPSGTKTLSGISILGNQESPKSLVIVPWKSSEIGDMPGLSRLLDDSVQPVDMEVFMRELDYYQIRSNPR